MGSSWFLADKWAVSLENTPLGPLPSQHHPGWAGERLEWPRAVVGRRRLVGPMWPSGGLELLPSPCLGLAALVWTWRMGGMGVLREWDVTIWPRWRRGCGGGFHICPCSAASHYTGDLWLGWCVTPCGVCTVGTAGPAAGLGEAAAKDLAAAGWPQVVLLHLGSTDGHQEQPRVSVTTWLGLCWPRCLS